MKKNLIAVAILSAFGLAGCGSDSDSGSSTPAATSTSFSGTVNKGIVSNGKVEICSDFAGSTCETDGSYYQTATTSETGSYDVTGAPLDTPLLVLVSKQDSTTTMKCDTDSCIDNSGSEVDFGTEFEVAENWTLKTIIPAANSATATVNVTSLTDIAADEAIEVADGGEITETIAKNANIAVQKAFGLTSDITKIGALDLTDAEAVAEATTNNTEELKAATYSAVLLNIADDDKKTLVTFDDTTGGYTVNVTSSNESDVTVTGLLNDAGTLLATVEIEANEKLGEDANISLSNLVAEIQSDAGNLPTETPAVESTSEVAAAKEFITDIRTAYNAVQDEGDLKTELTDFQGELGDIDDLVSDDLDTISAKLADATLAISEAFNDAEDSEIQSVTTYLYSDGEYNFEVSINGGIYSIGTEESEVYVVATINNNITDTKEEVGCGYEYESNNCSDGSTHEGDASLSLTKVKVTSGDSMLIADGSATIIGTTSWTKEVINGNSTIIDKTNIDELTIKLENVILSYLPESSETAAAKFTGSLGFSFNGLVYGGIEKSLHTSENNLYIDEYTSNSDVTITDMNLTLNGELTANEESVSVYLKLAVDNNSGFIYKTSETDTYTSWSDTFDYNFEHEHEHEHESENEEQFVKVTAIARVETTLLDADGDVTSAFVELNTNRNQYDAVDTTVTINYNDVATVLQADIGLYDAGNSLLTIKNTTGAVATINAFDENVDYTGTITIDGVEAATISETDNGAVLVRYTDGTFESLF